VARRGRLRTSEKWSKVTSTKDGWQGQEDTVARDDDQSQSRFARSTVNTSELFPLLSKQRAPLATAFFAPVALTLVTIASLWWTDNVRVISAILVLWLGTLSLMFLHVLSGRHRPLLWVFAGLLCGAAGAASLSLYFELFADPAANAALAERLAVVGAEPFPRRVWFWLVVAGLPEEFVKALPVAVAVAIGMGVRSEWGRRLGVFTPLDGVLLGAAAGIGFTCEESFSYAGVAAEGGNHLAAVMQVLNRNVGQFGGHPAWAGYVGYCLGLGVLRRRHLAALAIGGWLLSSLLHASYNATAGPGPRAVQLAIIIGSWALLAAAVLKARQLASRSGAASWTPATTSPRPTAAAAVVAPAPAPAPAPHTITASPSPASPAAAVVVWGRLGTALGTTAVQWRLGDRLLVHEVDGVDGAAPGDPLAEIVGHPTDRHVVGLRNLSGDAWTAVVAAGEEQIVRPGQSLRLAPGVRLMVGTTKLTIEKVR
jgi:RsiW-degrading membrane proteinase PrsW (M82 family)